MMKSRVLLPLLTLFATGWCALASAADAPEVIRFGVATVGKGGTPFAAGSVTGLAHQRKAVEEELKADNIRVDWVFFKGAGPAVNEALANKQLDFAWQGDLPAVIAKAGGLNTKLITADSLLTSVYLVVPADSPAKTLEDLKGKKVAQFKGTNLQLATARTLKAEGLSERDFRTVNMEFSTMSSALASKDIDGAWMPAQAFDLQAAGVARIIYDTRAKSPKFTRQGHVLVDAAFEQKYPAVVQKVVDALVKTAAWATTPGNEEAALALWANAGVRIESLRAEQEGQSFIRRYSPRIDEFFIDRYRATVTESRELGLLRSDVEVKDWVEPKYVNNALERLGFKNLWPEYDANNQPKKAL